MNDVHVSKDTIQDFFLNWEEALGICKKHGVHDIIIGGDLWQSRAQQTLDTLLAVREAVKSARTADVNLIITEGNHDLVDQEALLGYSHLFSDYPGVTAVDDYAFIDYEGVELCVMSYFPENGSFTRRLEEAAAGVTPGKKHILYIHQGINGALAVPSETDLPAKIFTGWDMVLVGHYHDRCRFGNIEYIGASRQHNFGEAPEKGYTLMYDDGTYEFIHNSVNVRFRTVELGVDELTEEKVRELTADGTKVKVKVSCTAAEAAAINKQDLLLAGLSKVEIQTEQTRVESQEHDFDVKFDKNGIKKEYVEFCSSKEADAGMGLQYLEKISCGV